MSKTDLEKHHDEVKAQQLENHQDRVTQLPAEHQSYVDVTNQSGDEKTLDVDAFDGRVHINTHGVAVLDREATAGLIKRLQRAWQVVA